MCSEIVNDEEEDDREGHAVLGRDLLGEQVGDGHQSQNQSGEHQADGNLAAGQMRD